LVERFHSYGDEDRALKSRAKEVEKRKRANSQNAVNEPWGVHNAYVLPGMKRMSKEKTTVVSRWGVDK
jgi:hypothetical protein